MPSHGDRQISLDQLAAGKLPKRVLDAIGNIEVTLEEVAAWDQERPTLRLTITDREFRIEGRKRIGLKRAVAVISGVVGAVWALLQYGLPMLLRVIS